jgi:hypothetical protein
VWVWHPYGRSRRTVEPFPPTRMRGPVAPPAAEPIVVPRKGLHAEALSRLAFPLEPCLAPGLS